MFQLFREKARLVVRKYFLFNEGVLLAVMFTFLAVFSLRVGTIMCHMGFGIPPVFRELNNFTMTRALPVGYELNDSCGFYLSKGMSEGFPSEQWKKSPGYTSKKFPVRAVASGIVYFCANCMDERESMVRIIHNTKVDGIVQEIESIYSGLDEILVEPGRVQAGEILGFVEEEGTLTVQIRSCLLQTYWHVEDNPCGISYPSSGKW